MYAHVTARCTPGPPPMRRRDLREVGPIRCPALCGPLPPSSAAEASRGLSLFRRRASRVLVRSAPARARAPHGNQSRPGTRQWQRRSSTRATKISTASATVPAALTPTHALAATHKNASKPALCVAPATQPRARAPTRPYSPSITIEISSITSAFVDSQRFCAGGHARMFVTTRVRSTSFSSLSSPYPAKLANVIPPGSRRAATAVGATALAPCLATSISSRWATRKNFPGSSAAGDEHVLALVDNCVHYGFLFR